MTQLLLCLRYYATGSMYITVGDFSGVSKASVSRVIKRVTNAIANLRPHHIHMPNTEEEFKEAALQFFNIARFPKVIGTIDCTHVKIASPGKNFQTYFMVSVI